MSAAFALFGAALGGLLFAAIACERARLYGMPISLLRPSALLPGALAAALSAWLTHDGRLGFSNSVTIACAVVSAVTDIQTGLIFDRVLLAATLLLLPAAVASARVGDAFCGAAVTAGLLLLPYAFSRGRGIGLGDVKLAATLGLGVGSAGALATVGGAAISGGIVALWLLVAGRVTRRSALPFGPFLAFGATYAIATSA